MRIMSVRNIIIIIFILVVSIYAFNIDLKVVNYDVKSKKIKDNIKIAFVSDLHSCDYGKNQEELLNKLNSQEVDIVLLGGDIYDDDIMHDKAEEFIRVVSKKYPCFYVSGNHEYRSGEIEKIKIMVEKYGVHVLEGESETVEIRGQTIEVFGIDDLEIGKTEFNQQLKNCGKNINNSIFSVLIAHRPDLINIYKEYGFDLILAGHTHGGQWRIPGVLNGLLAPNQGLFPKYAGGLYKFDNLLMIVGRGLAKESTRVPRIFNPPEIVIVDVIAE